MGKKVLITGATSGIGRACAEKFAQNGFDVIITGRRADRLHRLQEELEKNPGVEVLVLPFDVSNRQEAGKAIGSLNGSWAGIDILINNAGLALDLKPIHEGNPEDWDVMVDTNIKGLLYVTRLISEKMAALGKGHIINIGSIAGKEVYPNGNVYSATKHAIDGLTKAMRIDLMKYGIKVTQIAPGAVETEFSEVRFKGDKERAKKVYEGYRPLVAEDVADAVFYAASVPPHVNINDLVIMPAAQAGSYFFNKK